MTSPTAATFLDILKRNKPSDKLVLPPNPLLEEKNTNTAPDSADNQARSVQVSDSKLVPKSPEIISLSVPITSPKTQNQTVLPNQDEEERADLPSPSVVEVRGETGNEPSKLRVGKVFDPLAPDTTTSQVAPRVNSIDGYGKFSDPRSVSAYISSSAGRRPNFVDTKGVTAKPDKKRGLSGLQMLRLRQPSSDTTQEINQQENILSPGSEDLIKDINFRLGKALTTLNARLPNLMYQFSIDTIGDVLDVKEVLQKEFSDLPVAGDDSDDLLHLIRFPVPLAKPRLVVKKSELIAFLAETILKKYTDFFGKNKTNINLQSAKLSASDISVLPVTLMEDVEFYGDSPKVPVSTIRKYEPREEHAVGKIMRDKRERDTWLNDFVNGLLQTDFSGVKGADLDRSLFTDKKRKLPIWFNVMQQIESRLSKSEWSSKISAEEIFQLFVNKLKLTSFKKSIVPAITPSVSEAKPEPSFLRLVREGKERLQKARLKERAKENIQAKFFATPEQQDMGKVFARRKGEEKKTKLAEKEKQRTQQSTEKKIKRIEKLKSRTLDVLLKDKQPRVIQILNPDFSHHQDEVREKIKKTLTREGVYTQELENEIFETYVETLKKAEKFSAKEEQEENGVVDMVANELTSEILAWIKSNPFDHEIKANPKMLLVRDRINKDIDKKLYQYGFENGSVRNRIFDKVVERVEEDLSKPERVMLVMSRTEKIERCVASLLPEIIAITAKYVDNKNIGINLVPARSIIMKKLPEYGLEATEENVTIILEEAITKLKSRMGSRLPDSFEFRIAA